MDLSRLRCRGDQSMAVALTCLGSWSSLVTDLQDDGEIRIVVRDEVWRQMRLGLRAVQAVDSDLRLSRADKKIQILSGGRRGSHPPAPTDPGVTVSRYPALVILVIRQWGAC
jgi:hypothetical protein